MERIDSHQHFWKYDPSRQDWMTGDMQILKKDYGFDELAVLLNQCGLHGSVAVQASQTEAENDFLLGLAEEHRAIKGIVGWVDLQSETVSERLSFYATTKKIKGFRHVIHDEEDTGFMLRPAFLHGIQSLQEFHFTYDLLIYPHHLPNALTLVRQFPHQLFVIDHMAKPNIRAHEIAPWKKLMTPLASLPNVYCKISGMVTEATWQQWQQDDFTPYLDAVVELFGTKRILYGSDWPVCTLSGTYAEAYRIVETYFERFSASEQDDFFGMNAKRFYRL